jgi:hypothetical protein
LLVIVCVTVGVTEVPGRGVLEMNIGMVDDEVELELETVPLRGACEVDGGIELDGAEVVLKTWLDVKMTLVLGPKDGLVMGDGVGMGLEELDLNVVVVEDWTWLIGEEKDEVVVVVEVEVVIVVEAVILVVVGNGTEENKTAELGGEELGDLELVVVVLVVTSG